MSFVWDRNSGKVEPVKTIKVAKSAIVMTLDEYEGLAGEYVETAYPEDEWTTQQLYLSQFIVWLRQRLNQ